MILKGTCIITFTTEDAIWVGADTKSQTIKNIGILHNETPKQKIFEQDNFFYFFTGVTQAWDNRNHILFDAKKLMDISIKEFKTHELIISNYIKEVSNKLMLAALQALKDNPTYFARNMLNKPLFDGQLIEFTNGLKKIKGFAFSIHGTNQRNWKVIEQPPDVDENSLVSFSGTSLNAQNYFMQNFSTLFPFKNIQQLLLDLIKIESQKSSDKVGLPIDILIIYNNRHEWCRNIF